MLAFSEDSESSLVSTSVALADEALADRMEPVGLVAAFGEADTN